MKIYIVEGVRDYEFSWIEAVFAYRHDAEDYIKKVDNDELHIVEEELRGF